MEHYFKQNEPIFNRNNEATIRNVLNRFIDEVKGEIEA